MNELSKSSLVGGNKPVATYTRDGLEVGTAPIEEYVVFRKLNISDTTPFSFIYSPSDLRIVSIQADQDTSNYKIELFNPNGTRVFVNQYQLLVFDPAYLIVPKGYKCQITPIANLTNLSLIATQCSILSTTLIE
ncbi:MAG: hypothetical protein KME17_08145 [Cyanosarcina radialis HA8281-LM2]|jgi:hypothetical protein|nr:hypothetical protein [Cyanosarcina radialis HA8281-LM2]